MDEVDLDVVFEFINNFNNYSYSHNLTYGEKRLSHKEDILD